MKRLLSLAIAFWATLASAFAQSITVSPSGSGGAVTAIATITANNTASTISFSGSNWSSNYNTLFLNCEGLLQASAAPSFFAYVGEGGGPTWETTAHYQQIRIYEFGGGGATPSADSSSTATDLVGLGMGSGTLPSTFKLWIDNVSSTTRRKIVTWFYTGAQIELVYGQSYWDNDNAAITGLQLSLSGSVNFSEGKCSLQGFN